MFEFFGLLLVLPLSYSYVRQIPTLNESPSSVKKNLAHQDVPPLHVLNHQGVMEYESQMQQFPIWHSQALPNIQPKTHFQVPAPGVIDTSRKCPLSPFALYLTDGEQEALHELITEARQSGASEPEIKEHINRYLKEILAPDKLEQFEQANAKFERERFSSGKGEFSSYKHIDESPTKNLLASSNDTKKAKKLSNILLETI